MRRFEYRSVAQAALDLAGAVVYQRGALARDNMMPESIFDREAERQAIRQCLAKRRPFLIHGPTGVGKSLLLRSLLPEFPSVLYCEDSATTHVVFRSLANSLLRLRSPRARSAFRNEEAIKTKSAVSLKGIVMDALNEGQYAIVLDHLGHPSHSFAAAVREMMSWGSTPVSAVARSSHMEDTGFLQPLYLDRSEKCEIRNFEKSVAEQFAREVVRRTNLTASNMHEFLDKILRFSEGNPGAIVALVETAKHPKYRSEEHIKIGPLCRRLTALTGAQLSRSLPAYRAVLYDWSDRTLGQVQRRFDAYANSYRAQVERLLGNQEMRTGQDEDSIRRDLESLESAVREKTLAS